MYSKRNIKQKFHYHKREYMAGLYDSIHLSPLCIHVINMIFELGSMKLGADIFTNRLGDLRIFGGSKAPGEQ